MFLPPVDVNPAYVAAAVATFACREAGVDTTVRLLLAIDRRTTVADARDTLRLARELREETGGVVVGLDLSGDPSVSDRSVPSNVQCNLALKPPMYSASSQLRLPMWPKYGLYAKAHLCTLKSTTWDDSHTPEGDVNFEVV